MSATRYSMSTTTSFSFLRVAALVALIYCVWVWYLTEQTTGWGEEIYQWRQEYFGDDGVPSGSIKFRTPRGRLFVSLSLPWGFVVYPLTVLGAIYYVKRGMAALSLPWRSFYVAGALMMIAILFRFFWLGVFTTVSASF